MDSTQKAKKSNIAKDKGRKFTTYNALMLAMRRAKVPMFGAHATLLLETFTELDGRLLASTVYARGLCDEKQFRDWRKNLVDKGWLIWNENQNDKGVYFPGKKLMPYINKELLSREQVATRSSVEKVREDLSQQKADRSELDATRKELIATKSKLEETSSKLEETNRVVAKIAKAVRKLQKAKEPPITAEKLLMQRLSLIHI